MVTAILTSLLSLIGGSLSTLVSLKVFPTTLTKILSEIHQQKNRVLLEDIKKDNQVQIEGLKHDFSKKLEEVKLNYQKNIEIHKTALLDVARYSEYQFKLYNELWASLYDLKHSADELWTLADTSNLKNFAQQLNDTKKKIGQNVLLINEVDYIALMDIIETFEKFRIGKVDLISFRNKRINHNNINQYDIEIIISNEMIKNHYNSLLDKLAIDFKVQISKSTLSMENKNLSSVV
ncbi:hypothetical protein V5E38_14425 [Rossellomorea sp. GAMAL-10_SWC]